MDNLIKFFLLTVPMLLTFNLQAQDCGVAIEIVEENNGYVLKANAKGADAFTYLWSTGETARSIVITERKEYCVTITTPNGCTADACVTFDNGQGDCLVEIKREKTSAGVVLTADPRPSDGVVEIEWTGGSQERSILVTRSGEYCVKVAFNNGCTASKCVKVDIPDRDCKVEIRKEIVDGGYKLTAVPSPNTTPDLAGIKYEWSNGETGQSIIVTERGKYCVVAYFGDYCVADACIQISDSRCKVEIRKEIVDDGYKLTAIVGNSLSNVANVTYQWSTGETTRSIIVGAPGTYCVVVRYGDVCVAEDCIELRGDGCKVEIRREVVDEGIKLTAIGVSITPATTPPIFIWSTGDTAQSIIVTERGEYCVVGYFGDFCKAEACIDLRNNDHCKVHIQKRRTDEGILLTAKATPANVDARYFWEIGDSVVQSQSILVTRPGEYCVKIINANGCEARSCIKIEDDNPNCSVEIVRRLSDDGHLILHAVVRPDDVPARFMWSTGDSTQSIRVTERGEYCVKVIFASTDAANSCQASDCIVIGDEADCKVEIVRELSATGTIILYAKVRPEGFPTRFHWSTGDSTQRIEVTERGEYCVKVQIAGTDLVNTCEASDCIVIGDDHPNCKVEIHRETADDGAIILTAKVRPEDVPVRFLWSTGDSTQRIKVTERGEYCVKVIFASTDAASSCEASDCISIGEDKFCKVDIVRELTANGTLILYAKVRPQNHPVRFMWSTGDTTQRIEVTERGEYCVKVSVVLPNGNRCEADDCVVIGDEADCSVKIVRSLSDNGTIILTAVVRPDSVPVRFMWSTGDSTQRIEVTERGEYCVKVTFAGPNGNICEAKDCIEIGGDECKVEIVRRLSIEGELYLVAIVRPEGVPVRYQWSTGDSTQMIKVTEEGEYCVKVQLAIASTVDGCTAHDCINVKFDRPCGITFMRQITSAGLLVTAKPRPAGLLEDLFWNTGDTARTILITEPGEYCVEASFSNGCTAKECFIIEDIDELCKVEIFPRRTGNGIKLHAVARPSQGIDSIRWSTGETEKNIVVTEDGEYCVTVYWEGGCVADACVNIEIPNETDSCRAVIRVLNGGHLQARSNGQAPYTYLWNTGEVSKNIKVNEPGEYCVTITDANGCISQSCVELESIDQLNSNATSAINNTTGFVPNKSKVSKNALVVLTPNGNSQTSELKIRPNPARNEINFDLHVSAEAEYEISVHNMQGQLTHFEKMRWHKGQAGGRILVSNLPEGFYILKIQSPHALITKRFLKQ